MIDLIHDVVEGYRKVVDANSYPGDIHSLETYVMNINAELKCYRVSWLLMHMLLDGEVSVEVVGEQREEVLRMMTQYTYVKRKGLEDADFIFVLASATREERAMAMQKAKAGTLVNPHQSATLIYEVNQIDEGQSYIVEGPGIKDSKQVTLNLSKECLEARADKNIEYPMGVEVMLVDKDARILALPRTTQVKEVEA